jgi:hypothetical protein
MKLFDRFKRDLKAKPRVEYVLGCIRVYYTQHNVWVAQAPGMSATGRSAEEAIGKLEQRATRVQHELAVG